MVTTLYWPLHPQACKEKTDAFLFLFSFTDRASFEDLPGQLTRVAGEAPGVVRMIIGSKYPLGGPQDSQGKTWTLPLPRCGVQPHGPYLQGCSRASPRPWVWGSREEGEGWV